MKSNKLLCILMLVISISSNAQQPDSLSQDVIFDMSLEELLHVKINVSSTLPLDIFQSPSTVTIIDREIIEQYNFLDIAEAVRMVAGVEILQTVIDRNVPTIRGILQNFYANKVLLMIDNVPVWHPTYGNSTLDRLSINDVERIEVLKGPASVLYGTNAFNGVINIILRSPEKTALNAKVDAGYPDLGTASVNFTHKKKDFTYTISGSSSMERRNPYLVDGGADTLFVPVTIIEETDTNEYYSQLYENDTSYYFQEEYRKYSFSAKLGYKSHNLYINSFLHSFNNPGINATYQTGANRPITDKGTLISYSLNNDFNNKTNLYVNLYYDYHYRDLILSQAVVQSARFSSYRIGGIVKLNYNFSDWLNTEIGTDLTRGHNLGHYIIDVASDSIIRENIKNEKDLIEGSLFGQVHFNYKWFGLLGGVRYTRNENFGGNISPRITTIIKINDKNVFKYVYGHSYRTPNQLEQYFDHWTVVGNPELKPEKATTYEFSYLTKIDKFYGQFTIYNSRYKDLIQRIRTTTDISQPAIYQNADQFDGYGFESEIKYQNPKIINVLFNYNLMRGKGESSENNFKYVPEHTVFLSIHKSLRSCFASTNMYYYSEVMGPWEAIPSQSMIDLHLGFQQNIENRIIINHTLSLKNITKSQMLIPEYIRKRPGVNSLKTTGFGSRIIYSFKIKF